MRIITEMRDKATFPENGVIYEGDYLPAIPYSEYIHDEAQPGVNVYDVRDFGARPSYSELMTEKIQSALDAAAATAGTVIVQGGRYVTGTLSIPSGVHLYIARDSEIAASRNLADFSDAFIKIKNVKNVTISGGGRLNGRGEYFVHLPKERPLLSPLGYTRIQVPPIDPMGLPAGSTRYEYRQRIRYAEDKYNEGKENIARPMYTVWVRGSENVTLENIIIHDAFSWTLVFDSSDSSVARDVVIDNNRHVANTDGIDIMGSSDIEIDHCFISTADDGLCIKAPRTQGHDSITTEDPQMSMKGTKDIRIHDCAVCSVMNAFKIGTETYFDISNVEIKDCTFFLSDIYPGGVSGISIESADGSNISDIKVSGLKMKDIMCPLFICLNRRKKFGSDAATGSISNVSIMDIEAEGAEIPSLLTGFAAPDGEKGYLRNILVEDFHVTYLDNQAEPEVKTPVHENIDEYPESNAFGDLPAYGIYARHIDGLRLGKISVKGRKDEKRELIIQEDCI